MDSTDLWKIEEDIGVTKIKKILSLLSPISGTGRRRLAVFLPPVPQLQHVSDAGVILDLFPNGQSTRAGCTHWMGDDFQAGIFFYCPSKSAGKTLPPLLRIKAKTKTNLSSCNDGKPQGKQSAGSVQVLAALE